MNNVVMIGKKPFIITKKYKNGKMVVEPVTICEDIRGNLEDFTYDELIHAASVKANEEKIVVKKEHRDMGVPDELDMMIEEVMKSGGVR